MGVTESDRVRIRNWNYAGAPLLFGLGCCPAMLAVAAWCVLTGEIVTKTGETDTKFLRLIFTGGIFTIVTVLMVHYALTSPVLWIELGDRVTYRIPLRRSIHDWSDVFSLDFENEQTNIKGKMGFFDIPLGEHRILVVILRNKRELRVKVTKAQEAAVKQLWQRYQSQAEPLNSREQRQAGSGSPLLVAEKPADKPSVEDLLNQASNLDADGEWEKALAIYEQLATRLQGQQDGEYAQNCAGQIREKVNQAKGG